MPYIEVYDHVLLVKEAIKSNGLNLTLDFSFVVISSLMVNVIVDLNIITLSSTLKRWSFNVNEIFEFYVATTRSFTSYFGRSFYDNTVNQKKYNFSTRVNYDRLHKNKTKCVKQMATGSLLASKFGTSSSQR